MNTQLERPRGHTSHEDDPHFNVASEGHDSEHHGEKKSVLKKVKAKAKKIKETIKGHVGHGNELDHGHEHDEDEDDEMDTDPEVHDAHTSQSTISGQHGAERHHGTKLGERTPTEEVTDMPVRAPGSHQTHDPATAGYIPGTRLPISAPASAAGSAPVAEYQTFDPTSVSYTPGDEETLGRSRTDTGGPRSDERPFGGHRHAGPIDVLGTREQDAKFPMGSEEQFFTSSMPVAAASGGVQGAGLDLDSVLGTGETDMPDTRRPVGFKEQQYALKNMPVAALSGGIHGGGFDSALGTGEQDARRLARSDGTPVGAHSGGLHGAGHDSILSMESDTRREERPYAPKNTPVNVHSDGAHGTSVLGTEGLGTRMAIGSQERPYEAHSGGAHGADILERGHQGFSGEIGGVIERAGDLQKDPHAPKDQGEALDPGNYQTKTTDLTGIDAQEVCVTPLLHHLDMMRIHEESDKKSSTGQEKTLSKPSLGHDLPTSTGASDEKLFTGSHDQFSPEPITSETSTFLQEPETQALGANRPCDQGSHEEEKKQGSYTEKMSSAASMVADKAKQATTAVTLKLGYGGASTDQSPTESTEGHDLQNKQQSEKGSYGETLSSVTAAIADKATQVKDDVASKLGYGGTAQEGESEQTAASEEQPKAGSEGGLGKKVTITMQEKLAPVYEKAAEVGSTLALKMQGSKTEHGMGTATNVPDKGVSVKEYLAEKLRPSEEDKALSQVITEVLPLHKQKDEATKQEEEGKKVLTKGRVTESEEVRNRLGGFDEMSDENVGSGEASPRRAVFDRIKDAATSWFGKGGETQPIAKGYMDTSEGKQTERTQ